MRHAILPVDWLMTWLMCRCFKYWGWRTGKPMFTVRQDPAEVAH